MSVWNIRVTKEMRRVLAQYRIAVEELKKAPTEAHVRFWEKEIERLRANLMSIMDWSVGDIVISNPGRGVFFIEPEEDRETDAPTAKGAK